MIDWLWFIIFPAAAFVAGIAVIAIPYIRKSSPYKVYEFTEPPTYNHRAAPDMTHASDGFRHSEVDGANAAENY